MLKDCSHVGGEVRDEKDLLLRELQQSFTSFEKDEPMVTLAFVLSRPLLGRGSVEDEACNQFKFRKSRKQ